MKFAVPSAVFKAIFPVKPSVTITSVLSIHYMIPFYISTKFKIFKFILLLKLSKFFLKFHYLYFLLRPIFSKAILVYQFKKRDLNRAAPIQEKSTNFFHYIQYLLLRSRTTFIFFDLAIDAAKAGLLIPAIVFKSNLRYN